MVTTYISSNWIGPVIYRVKRKHEVVFVHNVNDVFNKYSIQKLFHIILIYTGESLCNTVNCLQNNHPESLMTDRRDVFGSKTVLYISRNMLFNKINGQAENFCALKPCLLAGTWNKPHDLIKITQTHTNISFISIYFTQRGLNKWDQF